MLVLPMLNWLRARWETARADQRGMTTETVILIAIFAGLAIAAAQDGARAARVEGATAADGATRANQLLDQTGRSILQGRHVSVQRGPDITRVDVRGSCIQLVPFLRLPVHAVVESTTERFRGRRAR